MEKKKKSSSELYEEWPKHISEGSKHTGQEKKCIKGIQLFPVKSQLMMLLETVHLGCISCKH